MLAISDGNIFKIDAWTVAVLIKISNKWFVNYGVTLSYFEITNEHNLHLLLQNNRSKRLSETRDIEWLLGRLGLVMCLLPSVYIVMKDTSHSNSQDWYSFEMYYMISRNEHHTDSIRTHGTIFAGFVFKSNLTDPPFRWRYKSESSSDIAATYLHYLCF